QVLIVLAISRGNPRQPPNVDTVRINDSLYITADTVLALQQFSAETLWLQTYPHGFTAQDTIIVTWTATKRSNLTPATDALSSTAARYFYAGTLPAIADSIDTIVVLDTIKMTAVNGRGYSLRKYFVVCLVHPVAGRGPIIDSVSVGNRHFAADTAALLSYSAVIVDSVPLDAFARGFNSLEVVNYRWSASSGANLVPYATGAGKKAYYKCTGTTCRDTVAVANAATVVDTVTVVVTRIGNNQSRQSIVLKKAPKRLNRAPYFDSITVADTVFKGADSAYGYLKARARDTLRMSFAIRDSDAVLDSLYFKAAATDTAGFGRPVRTSKNLYKITLVCRDASYVDTLTATASDQWLASRSKQVYITVTK
ncbi:MAG: hypothetical protein PHC61_02090, partial [Chitinivibrionales bacterium]|nr:hypothetical protein [Chitinivibrionales bacterium]